MEEDPEAASPAVDGRAEDSRVVGAPVVSLAGDGRRKGDLAEAIGRVVLADNRRDRIQVTGRRAAIDLREVGPGHSQDVP